MQGLLDPDEPAPFEVMGRDGASAFVVVCDHAGRLVPKALGDLGVGAADRDRHIAWDIGAGEVARRLGAALDAFVVTQTYSRLVIDCNRPLEASDSIVSASDGTAVPGNAGIARPAAEARARAVFHPYHDQIRRELDRRRSLARAACLISVHSFTPVWGQAARPWHAGVLYLHDRRMAVPLLRLLRAEPDLVIGENEPYRADPLTDFTVVEHAERRGLPYVEVEIRQDLIADEAGQVAWATRLARLLPLASRECASTSPPEGSSRTENEPSAVAGSS